MAARAEALTVAYWAYDSADGTPKTGDVANHTLRWVKDGVPAALTNSPAEIDAVNTPGLYKVLLTNQETDCSAGFVAGKSSTTGVVVQPSGMTFEYLPNAAPGAAGGLPTVDSSNRIAGVQASGRTAIAADVRTDLLDTEDAVETGWSLRSALRIVTAVLAGKVAGAGSGALIFRAINDEKARVTATTDANGNRTAVILDPD